MLIDLKNVDHTELVERVALTVVDGRADEVLGKDMASNPMRWSAMPAIAQTHIREAMLPVILATISSLQEMERNRMSVDRG